MNVENNGPKPTSEERDMKTRTRSLQTMIRNASIALLAVLGLACVVPNAAEAGRIVRVRVAKSRVVIAPRVVVRTAPVKAVVTVRPARPAHGKYVWVSGHYAKRPGCRRVWVKGHWKRIG